MVRTATDLKDIILQKAGELFAQQGYTATSNKQIAKAAGCTTAALYYYFEGGKSQLLREVIRSYALDLSSVFEVGQNAESLQEFLVTFGQSVAQVMPEMLRRIVWLQPEFSHLPDAEKAAVQSLFVSLHNGIYTHISRFVKDDEVATRLAWLLFCAYFGYEQVFLSMQVGQQVPFGIEAFTKTLAENFVFQDS